MVIQLIDYAAKNRSYLTRCLAEIFPTAQVKVSPTLPLPLAQCLIIAYSALQHPRIHLQLFQLRQTYPSLPIFVYDCPTPQDLVNAFKLGAHEGMIAPFHPYIFSLRLKRLLTPTQPLQVPIRTKYLQLFPGTHVLMSSTHWARLSPKQYALFAYLLYHQGQNVSRVQLINTLWATKPYILENTIDCHIKALRLLLKKMAVPSFITTIYGIGYRFEEK